MFQPLDDDVATGGANLSGLANTNSMLMICREEINNVDRTPRYKLEQKMIG